MPFDRLLAWSGAGIVVLYAVLVVSALTFSVVSILSGSEWLRTDVEQRIDLLRQLVGAPALTTTALLAAVAVHEELLFRGLLMAGLRKWLGWTGALAVSSILFGVLHLEQGWVAIAQATGLGLVLGGLCMVSGSIWPAVLAHFAFDRLQFAFAEVAVRFLAQVAWPSGN